MARSGASIEENSFRFFDFTEGQSDHKKLFATDSVHCANVFFLRNNLHNLFLSYMQIAINQFSKLTGDALEHFGVKTTYKKTDAVRERNHSWE